MNDTAERHETIDFSPEIFVQCHRLSTQLRHIAFMAGNIRGQTHQMIKVLTAVRVAKANDKT